MTRRQIFGWVLLALLVYIGYPKSGDAPTTKEAGDKAQQVTMATPTVSNDHVSEPRLPGPEAYTRAKAEAKKAENKWIYQTQKDEMRGVTNRWADLASDNSEQFAFPYDGGSRLHIILRDMPKKYGRDVLLKISKGQIDCGFDGCRVPIKFDDGKILTYTANRSGSGNTDVIFINEVSGFTRRIKKAKRVVVEIPMYREGPVQFTFSPGNLDWK